MEIRLRKTKPKGDRDRCDNATKKFYFFVCVTCCTSNVITIVIHAEPPIVGSTAYRAGVHMSQFVTAASYGMTQCYITPLAIRFLFSFSN